MESLRRGKGRGERSLLLLLLDDCCWFCDLRLNSEREEMRDSRPLDRGLSGELLEET